MLVNRYRKRLPHFIVGAVLESYWDSAGQQWGTMAGLFHCGKPRTGRQQLAVGVSPWNVNARPTQPRMRRQRSTVVFSVEQVLSPLRGFIN